MQKINIFLVMVIPFLFSACSINETCDEPQPYQESYESNDFRKWRREAEAQIYEASARGLRRKKIKVDNKGKI